MFVCVCCRSEILGIACGWRIDQRRENVGRSDEEEQMSEKVEKLKER